MPFRAYVWIIFPCLRVEEPVFPNHAACIFDTCIIGGIQFGSNKKLIKDGDCMGSKDASKMIDVTLISVVAA